MDFKFTCESLVCVGYDGGMSGLGRWVQDSHGDGGGRNSRVVGGGVVGELVFRHSPTCRLVSDHRGK